MIVCRWCTGLADSGVMPPMKYWEIVADKLSAAGWTWGYCSAVTCDGWRWVVDAYRGDGRRYIVQSDELLSTTLMGATLSTCLNNLSPLHRLRTELLR